MATTRIISMHQNKGKAIDSCLANRIDYALNPEKTKGAKAFLAIAHLLFFFA